MFRPEWWEILSFKNKVYLIGNGDNNDISLAIHHHLVKNNIPITSPCKKMHTPAFNTKQSQIILKRGKPIGQVTKLEECTETINSTKNYDLSENNLQCGQTLKL